MTFMTMTIMTTSVPKMKNGMYIDFVHFFENSSKKFVDRNGKVVPLHRKTLRKKIATLKGNKKRCKKLDVRCKM